MKILMSLIVTSLISATAIADQILLECNIHYKSNRDTKTVVIADTSNGLVKREITRRGVVTETALPEKQWNSKNIRLSNDQNGFRHLRYGYSQVFQDTDWFVFGSGPGYQSEGRADCK